MAKSHVVETKAPSADDDSQQLPHTPLRPEQYDDAPPRHGKLVHTRTLRPRDFSHVFRCWWLECLTVLLVFLVLMALIIALDKNQGRPLRYYSLGISINTLTAIYTIILKAFCVFVMTEGLGHLKWLWFRKPQSLADFQDFDRASRGPWAL